MQHLIIVLWCAVLSLGADRPALMGVDDVPALANAPAGEKHAYGDDPLQFGELTLPDGDGPHPVVVFIHGGCWLAEYDLPHTHSLARALADEGFAVWNLEYRRVGDEGGGWPGTFEDIANGADQLRKLAKEHPLDLTRVVAMGHSAGGHLALWLAARPKLPEGSELHSADPLKLVGVVALTPAPELDDLHERKVCGHVIDKLMGGGPEQVPDRYRQGNPSQLAPLGVPQKLIVGKYDESWAWAGELYAKTAREARDEQVEVIVAPESGHFEVINPKSSTWPLVVDAVKALLAQK
jgi:acetyl esterase/lipase